MTVREMIEATPVDALDADQSELVQVLVLIERKDGSVEPVTLTPSPDTTCPFELCEFFLDNREEFNIVAAREIE
jgi:hypothetical protein